MLDHVTNIAIKVRNASLNERRDKLAMKNFFPVFKWRPEDMAYTLYTERALNSLHR